MTDEAQQPHTPPYDLMEVDDVIGSYPALSTAQRLSIKLGSATSEQDTRQHLDPFYTESLRALRRESLAEARLNASLKQEPTV